MPRAAHSDRIAAINARFGLPRPGYARRRHVLVEEGGVLSAYRPATVGGTLTEAEFREAVNGAAREWGFAEPYPETA